MTQQALEIEPIVGQFDAVPCDHARHDEPDSGHYGAATYYVRKHCPGCDPKPTVYAACQGYIDMFMTLDEWECPRCKTFGPASMFSTILGPVKP